MSRPLSPASASAAPLEDDDLLTEILLRLPPQPSSLPRASLVCKRWRRLVSNARFIRRFRIHHRRNPPLLGFFGGLNFMPAMESPNRLPYGCFCLKLDHGRGDDGYLYFHTLACRHDLLLIFLPRGRQLLVCDPATGDQHPIAIPPGFDALLDYGAIHGAVLRTDGDVQHFQVVIVATVVENEEEEEEDDEDEEQQRNARAVAQVYSSETSTWGNLISTSIPPNSKILLPPGTPNCVPDVLVGDSLYWVLGKSIILEFDLGTQRLAVVPLPVPVHKYDQNNPEFLVMRADGGGLGCLVLSNFNAQIWKRRTNCDGVASWVLGRTVELDKLLSMNPDKMRRPLKILGFAEGNSVVIVRADNRQFTIQLQSLQFKQLIDINFRCCYHPFESVYTAGMSIGAGRNGAELLDSA